MNRRRFLALAVVGLGGLAGCQSTNGPTSPTGSTEPPPTDSTSTRSPDRLEVSIATNHYRIIAQRQTPIQRAIDPDDIVVEADIPEPLHNALLDARSGIYETEQVGVDLLAAIDRFRTNSLAYRFQPYVWLDGEPFAFDPTVPVFVARLDTESEPTDPSRTLNHADLETLSEPARDFVRTVGAFTVESPRDEYRISVVPDAVTDLITQYNYVESPGAAGEIITERIDPGPPYSIEVRPLNREDLWGRSVIDGRELSRDLRQLLSTVAASDRRQPAHSPVISEYRTDSIPDAYFDRLRADPGQRDPYVSLDGSIYAFDLWDFDRAKLPVEVTATRTTDRSFAVTIRPAEEPVVGGPLAFESSGALPSVLWVETGSNRFLLSSDAYDSIRWEAVEGTGTERRIRNIARAEIDPKDHLSATYRIPEIVPSGTHRVWGWFTVSWTDAESGRQYPQLGYPFEVVLGLPTG